MTAENTLVTFVSNNIWITDTFSIFIITTYRLGSIFITKTFCKYFVHMSNSLFPLTLKITWSLAKILSGNCQIKPCSKLDNFVSRFQDWVHFACFDLLSFWACLWLVQTEKISKWKVKFPLQDWNLSIVTNQNEKYQCNKNFFIYIIHM